MQFLANENFPMFSVNKLRDTGYSVIAISQLMPGAKDERVLEYANSNSQIILTFDRDYGELIYKQGLPLPEGIIYLRFIPLTPEEPADLILTLLANQHIYLQGRFTIVRRNNVRQRPLPKPLV